MRKLLVVVGILLFVFFSGVFASDLGDYVHELGYTISSESYETIKDGMIIKTNRLISTKNYGIFQKELEEVYMVSVKEVNEDKEANFLAKITEEDGDLFLTFFDREGGIKIDLNNGDITDVWGVSGSCDIWHCMYYYVIGGYLLYDLPLVISCGIDIAICVGSEGADCLGLVSCVSGVLESGVIECFSDSCYYYPSTTTTSTITTTSSTSTSTTTTTTTSTTFTSTTTSTTTTICEERCLRWFRAQCIDWIRCYNTTTTTTTSSTSTTSTTTINTTTTTTLCQSKCLWRFRGLCLRWQECYPEVCEGTVTSCGSPGECVNCVDLNGCYSGYYRSHSCLGECEYYSWCSDVCCDEYHRDANAYCSGNVCFPLETTTTIPQTTTTFQTTTTTICQRVCTWRFRAQCLRWEDVCG